LHFGNILSGVSTQDTFSGSLCHAQPTRSANSVSSQPPEPFMAEHQPPAWMARSRFTLSFCAWKYDGGTPPAGVRNFTSAFARPRPAGGSVRASPENGSANVDQPNR